MDWTNSGLNSKDLKRRNTGIVLSTILSRGRISRKEIARQTGLTAATVSNLVKELLDRGYVEEAGAEDAAAERAGGPIPILLQIKDTDPVVVGVHVGTTRVRVAGFNLKAEIKCEAEFALDPRLPQDVLITQISERIRAVLGKPAADMKSILGVGVGVAGVIDVDTGTVRSHANPNLAGLPLRDLLQQDLGVGVVVNNLVNAMAMAEYWFGNGRDVKHYPLVFVGAVIGTALMINGENYVGAHQAAGHIGHRIVNPGGSLCTCGRKGCLDAEVSEIALLRKAREAAAGSPHSILARTAGSPGQVTRQHLLDAARDGDPLALGLLEERGLLLGRTIAEMVTLLDPEVVLLAGRIATEAPDLELPPIRRGMEQNLAGMSKEIQLVPSKFGNDLTVIGAASLLLKNVYAPPVGAAKDSGLIHEYPPGS